MAATFSWRLFYAYQPRFMQYSKFTFNPFQENTFILWDETQECIVIDPGCYYPHEVEELTSFIKSKDLKPVGILNTHCHIDHVLGVSAVKEVYDIPFTSHRLEQLNLDRLAFQADMFGIRLTGAVPTMDAMLEEGQVFSFGNTDFVTMFVPGHSPGHLAFYSEKDQLLVGGDVLFYESIGRTDLPGCNHQDLLDSIKDKLFLLPDATEVLPGHMQHTTIGHEKEFNPFLR